MKIISFLNFKGGVGKTTSTHSIGAGLSSLGKKVLLIDLDPQGSLTFFCNDRKLVGTSKDVLFHEKAIEDCIMESTNFDYIGSTLKLSMSEMMLNSSYNKEHKLRLAIENSTIKEKYDYLLLDCPPSLSIFSLNALTASDKIIIPCECEVASIEGLEMLMEALQEPIKGLNPNLKILGILPTKLDARKNLSKDSYEALKVNYENVLSPIRINSKLGELGLEKKSIFEIDKNSNGAKDYLQVVKEILNA